MGEERPAEEVSQVIAARMRMRATLAV